MAKRLQQLRGVGPMVATALLVTVGDASQFSNGRQMAAQMKCGTKRSDIREQSHQKPKTECLQKRRSPYMSAG